MYEGKFFESFVILEDKREQGKVKHKLIDIVFIVISAVICGCNEWKDIKLWLSCDVNIKWLKKYIELPNGIPSLSTIGRLFNIISPKQFEKCFANWMKVAVELPAEDIVSIDGKTCRGTIDENSTRGVHIVSAVCRSYGLVVGQVKTDEKSNEITAIPDLLDMLHIKGCVVSIDAMGCQKEIASKIIHECKADYVLSLKGNQEGLHNDVIECFDFLRADNKIENIDIAYNLSCKFGDVLGDKELALLKTKDHGHGRIETRKYYYTQKLKYVDMKGKWEGLKGVGLVVRDVEIKGKTSREASYFITSVKDVKTFEKAVRGHWNVESMHWSLDVTYKDDANKTRKGTAPQNMSLLKRIALNAVKNDKTKKPNESMKGKRFFSFDGFRL
jgi:predicted transposase YbfD/YdcC